MKTVKSLQRIYLGLWGVLICASVWIALALWPAGYWHDTGFVLVRDHERGEDFRVDFSGGPRAEFVGSYQIVMRRSGTGEIPSTPDGAPNGRGGPFPYVPNSKKPDVIRISWWAGDKWRAFTKVPAGSYYVDTCWTIHRPFFGLVPDKVTCKRSNVFRVLEPTGDSQP